MQYNNSFSPKAFNELRDYCDAIESDDRIRVILPFFVSHYRKWSTVRFPSRIITPIKIAFL
jgi:hypothetical protein